MNLIKVNYILHDVENRKFTYESDVYLDPDRFIRMNIISEEAVKHIGDELYLDKDIYDRIESDLIDNLINKHGFMLNNAERYIFLGATFILDEYTAIFLGKEENLDEYIEKDGMLVKLTYEEYCIKKILE